MKTLESFEFARFSRDFTSTFLPRYLNLWKQKQFSNIPLETCIGLFLIPASLSNDCIEALFALVGQNTQID